MIELFLFSAGIATGLALGLFPGTHINNFIPFFALLPFSSQGFFFLVIPMSMAFVFSSFFPSVLFGAPNEDTALSVLPGHKMLLRGDAYTALLLLFKGAFWAVLFSGVFLAFFVVFLAPVFSALGFAVPFVLAAVVVLMCFSSTHAILVVLLSSVLGFFTLDFNALLPLLSGFFGASTMLVSLAEKTLVSPQVLRFKPKTSGFAVAKSSFLACFLSAVFSTLPGVSSAVVGSLGRVLARLEQEEFLVLLGATSAAYMIFSFFVFALVGKTRSGSAAFLSQFSNLSILFSFGLVLLSGIVSFAACVWLAKPMVRALRRISYRKATLFSLAVIISANFLLAGFFGLAILFASTSLGLFCNFVRAPRVCCMATLITPTIFILLSP